MSTVHCDVSRPCHQAPGKLICLAISMLKMLRLLILVVNAFIIMRTSHYTKSFALRDHVEDEALLISICADEELGSIVPNHKMSFTTFEYNNLTLSHYIYHISDTATPTPPKHVKLWQSSGIASAN